MDDLWLALIAVALGYCVELVSTNRQNIDEIISTAKANPFTGIIICVFAWGFVGPESFMLAKIYYIGVFLATIFHHILKIKKHHG
jgi:hypothetical protein